MKYTNAQFDVHHVQIKEFSHKLSYGIAQLTFAKAMANHPTILGTVATMSACV